ncbi:hypothetical protein [Avibacterium endocarditidis]|uniref:Uncharacterized protein n=1 Tax=Avibacterium endocarditidis TaxID=380674 RepID=A0ABX4ZRU2_9PAST|nr:hypothetical protein [Avibacterium endocarditidis]POY42238.1 hypothetical protein C3Z13_06910 [Avibacterium endocarditidis]
MSCNPNVISIISPASIDPKGFSVGSKAVLVSAYGLNALDTITFKRVNYCSNQGNYKSEGCCIIEPTPAEIASAIPYQLGYCTPTLSAKRSTLVIRYTGNYIPVVNNQHSPDLTVTIEPINGTDFSDKELGIVPCGYQASVPLPISLDDGDCCGVMFMGYLFHPNETRDPEATVKIYDCEKFVGYAYPTAGDGHTLPIEECNGTIVGYAVNNSPTAPEIIQCN